MLFVISLLFIFLTRLRFPSKFSTCWSLKEKIWWKNFEIRKFAKTEFKHKKALLDLQFLKICEDHNVIPKFLRFKVANANYRTSLTYKWCQKKLLRDGIYNKKLLDSQLVRNSKLSYKNVKLALNIIEFHRVLNISLISNEKETN